MFLSTINTNTIKTQGTNLSAAIQQSVKSFNFENDGAYLNVAKDEKIFVSNDTIVEGVDFFTNDSADSIAHKIICYNLSDLSSMGASPYCFNLSLGLTKKISK